MFKRKHFLDFEDCWEEVMEVFRKHQEKGLRYNKDLRDDNCTCVTQPSHLRKQLLKIPPQVFETFWFEAVNKIEKYADDFSK